MAAKRWVIRGELTLLSPLALRTGRTEHVEPSAGDPPPAGVQSLENMGNDAGVLAVVLDHVGRPVIPGSSLKGVLRSYISSRGDPTTVKFVFGDYARKADKSDLLRKAVLEENPELRDVQIGVGGKAVFCEARIVGEKAGDVPADPGVAFPCVGRTAIDPETRTADSGMLRQERTVAAGTRFFVEIVADDATRTEINLVLAALQGFNDTVPITVGSGRGCGYGRARWDLTELHDIDAGAIAAWLDEKTYRHWTELLGDETAKRHAKKTAKDAAARAEVDPIPRISIELSIAFVSPFLVGDPARRGETGPDMQARLTVAPNGEPTEYLPASSVRGVLSSQAARIVRTLRPELEASERPPKECMRLFGSTDHVGAIAVSDFLPRRRPAVQTQEFVAIDRFTGGAAHGFKFQAEPVVSAGDDTTADPKFVGSIEIRLCAPTGDAAYLDATGKKPSGASPGGLGPADLGLLALLARDLVEGDLTFGHGSTKGYGMSRTTFESVTLNSAAVQYLRSAWKLDVGERLDQGELSSLLATSSVRDVVAGWVRSVRVEELAERG